jgi:hypothetical protein
MFLILVQLHFYVLEFRTDYAHTVYYNVKNNANMFYNQFI